jgi:hypothetical protein
MASTCRPVRRNVFIGDRSNEASRSSNRREWPQRTITYFSFGLVCMTVPEYFPHLLDENAMTDKPSPTVNSYSVHEDQLKWFDVTLVAGEKQRCCTAIPPNPGQWSCVLNSHQIDKHLRTGTHTLNIQSGKVYYGEGEKFDTSNPEVGKVGTFAIVPAGQAHFVWTLEEEAIVQLQFEGPSNTIYVDSADNPQRR